MGHLWCLTVSTGDGFLWLCLKKMLLHLSWSGYRVVRSNEDFGILGVLGVLGDLGFSGE